MNNDFLRALRPVKARLRRNRFLRGLVFGLLAGSAAAVCVRLLSLWIPLENRMLWTLLPIPAGVLLCAAGSALRPVRAKDAAEAADGAGLQERAVTALENAQADTEILRMQRNDACGALRRLDVKRIRPGSVKKTLAAALACLAALAALLFIRTPADRTAETRTALHRTLREGSEQVARAAEEDGERLSREERAELRRLTEELKRDLSESRDEADALVALDRAEQRLEQMRAQTAGEALAAAGSAQQADAAGNAQAEAQASGDEQREKAGASGNNAGNAANQAGGSTAAGQMPGSAAASRGTAPKTASALTALKRAVNPSAAQSSRQGQSGKTAQSGGGRTPAAAAPGGTSQGSGQAGGGSGNQGMQAGGGAGEGSTNLEQAGGGNGPGTGGAGTRDPRYKEEKYETIYDPEHAEIATRDEITNQNRLGDEGSVQAETGPGKGRLGGDVPWGEVLGEYAETETRSAERENLTGQEREWVREYFSMLTEQNEE